MTLILELTSEQEERLRQLARVEDTSPEALAESAIAQMLASPIQTPQNRLSSRPRNLLAFRGLGAIASVGKDAQEHVNDLRSEWDERP